MENLQANLILERIHQVLSNLECAFYLQNNYLNEYENLSNILAATDFSGCSTYHTMLQATRGQLVSGRNMILNTPLIADWEDIIKCKNSE